MNPSFSEFGRFFPRKIGKFSSELRFVQNGLNRYGPSSFPLILRPSKARSLRPLLRSFIRTLPRSQVRNRTLPNNPSENFSKAIS